jgi:hypothetical protein
MPRRARRPAADDLDAQALALVNAQAATRERVAAGVQAQVAAAVAALGNWYDPADVAGFVDAAATAVADGREVVATATQDYLVQLLDLLDAAPRRPADVAPDPEPRGIPVTEEWARPVKVYRYARLIGLDALEAEDRAAQRAERIADTDLTLAMRDAARDTLAPAPGVAGWRRVVHPEVSRGGACGLCIAASDRVYGRDALLAVHDRCACTVAPVVAGKPDPGLNLNADSLAQLYEAAGSTGAGALSRTRWTVQDHGELGPILRAAGDDFRGPADVRGDTGKPLDLTAADRPTADPAAGRDADFARWSVGRDRKLDTRLDEADAAPARRDLETYRRLLVDARGRRDQYQAELDATLAQIEGRPDELRGFGLKGGQLRSALAQERKPGGHLHRLEQRRESLAAVVAGEVEAVDRYEQLTADLRGKLAGNDQPLPDFTADNPLAGYGDRLHFDRSEAAHGHLSELERYVLLPFHRVVRDYMVGTDNGGIYVADKRVPDLDNLGRLRGAAPRGYTEGKTFDDSAGLHDPVGRVIACNGQAHGSEAAVVHEHGHATDSALGALDRTRPMPSDSPEWAELQEALSTATIGHGGLSPYYTQWGNPTGYRSESFAESYAAWSKSVSQHSDAERTTDLVLDALGVRPAGRTDADVIKAGRALVAYFVGLRARLSG